MVLNILRMASGKNISVSNPNSIAFFPNKKSYRSYKLYLNILFNIN